MAKNARDKGVRESNLLPTQQALVRQFSVIYSVNKKGSKRAARPLSEVLIFSLQEWNIRSFIASLATPTTIHKYFVQRAEAADTCLTLMHRLAATTVAPRFSFLPQNRHLPRRLPTSSAQNILAHLSKSVNLQPSNSCLGLAIRFFVCTKTG